MADLFSAVYNPDVLSCLSNLSNDEVFTPPELANEVLDMLPESIWMSTTARFLDPCSKSGVFLREIVKRLIRGQLPDYELRCAQIDHKRIMGEDLDGSDEAYLYRLQKVIDHIMQEQVFGIAITELTALMSRRSLYCSKWANSPYSVSMFDNTTGNLHFKEGHHVWAGKGANRKCKYCGIVPGGKSDREKGKEPHAYEFIHTSKPERFFNMQFDVIVGNPPYQLETDGYGRQAKPIYNLFVEQAMKLKPRYLTMIIQSRWFAGGMGLDDFRKLMATDGRVRKIVDYANAKDCFPQNSISGGVCYFLWDRDHPGACEFVNRRGDEDVTMTRALNEWPVLIRYNEGVTIVRKIEKLKEPTLDQIGSPLMPFGLSTKERGTQSKQNENDLILHSSAGASYIARDRVTKGLEFRDVYKVLMSKTGAEHAGEPAKDGMFRVLTSAMKVIGPGEVCTHSYFVIGKFATEAEAQNLLLYLKTRFVRFLVLQSMTSINVSKAVFQFVPQQDWSRVWTDDDLYEKYDLSASERAFINGLIREVE